MDAVRCDAMQVIDNAIDEARRYYAIVGNVHAW